MYSCTDTQAVCRGCGKLLKGSPYFKGGSASTPEGRSARVCYYGGWVCSYGCDVRACAELEDSMPGHGTGLAHAMRTLDRRARERIKSNWPDD